MTNLLAIESQLSQLLTQVTQVTKWDTIQFSMLPTDSPKGYLQLAGVGYGAIASSTWLVGIGIASTSLSGLKSQIYGILEAIESQLYQPQACLSGGGIVSIDGQIQVELPDSYANQSGISQTSGFRTAITFEVSVQSAR
jgi:hypothetical protein